MHHIVSNLRQRVLLSDATRVRRTAQKGDGHVGFHGRWCTIVAIVNPHEGDDAGDDNDVDDVADGIEGACCWRIMAQKMNDI